MLPNPSKQIRVLADGDCFYASCEIARRPELRGKVVIVHRLDICLAASYEAKALWIGLATPLRQIKKLLTWKEYYLFEADMGYYERISNQVFGILEENSKSMERFSVDECFYDRTWICGDTTQHVAHYATQLQHLIFQSTWMPLTFGFARTRLVAKMFCKFKKPFGVYGHLEQENITQALDSLELTDIPFIWRKRSAHLPAINTVWEFMRMNWESIKQKLKRDWLKLRLELHGYDALKITRQWWPSSIWRTRSFHPHFTTDKAILRKKLMMNFEKAYAQLVDEKLATKYITIHLRGKDFDTDIRKLRLKEPSIERKQLQNSIRELFEWVYRPWRLYRTTWITFSELVYQQHRQLSIFDFDESRRHQEDHQQTLQKTIDAINHKLWGMHITTLINADAIKKMDGSEFQKMQVQ